MFEEVSGAIAEPESKTEETRSFIKRANSKAKPPAVDIKMIFQDELANI